VRRLGGVEVGRDETADGKRNATADDDPLARNVECLVDSRT
jgi:hypothetical protein